MGFATPSKLKVHLNRKKPCNEKKLAMVTNNENNEKKLVMAKNSEKKLAVTKIDQIDMIPIRLFLD
jgi:hypothetical protein